MTTATDTIQVWSVSLSVMGRGPTFDSLAECLEHVRELFDDGLQGEAVMITTAEWPRKRFAELPEFEGY
jgi:hypothetical protein